jgi:hypothetical protein
LDRRGVRIVALGGSLALLFATGLSAGGSAAAGPRVKLVSNNRVNMLAPPAGIDGYVDNFPKNKQNEPAIARDPVTGAFVAGSNDEVDLTLCGQNPPWEPTLNDSVSCHFDTFAGVSGVYYSSDGQHWTQPSYTANPDGNGPSTIHVLPGYEHLGLISGGDPVISFGPTYSNGAFDPAHMTAYYANISDPNGLETFSKAFGGFIAVSRSYDDGHTWVDPVLVNPSPDLAGAFEDKENVYADATPSSPSYGNVYVCYSLFPGSPLASPELADRIEFSRSTDGGSTWSKVKLLSPSYNNNAVGGRQDCMIRTGPDGTVYVFWDDTIKKATQMVVAVSHDGGRTFGKRRVIGSFNNLTYPLPNAAFREFAYPAGAVDPVTGQVYVAYSSEVGGHAQLVLATSTDGGKTWSQAAAAGLNESATDEEFFPAIDVSQSGTVVVTYPAIRQGVAPLYTQDDPPGGDIPAGAPFGPGAVVQSTYAAVSTDHGVSFTTIVASTQTSDPDVSGYNNLAEQFLGDYTWVVATDHAAFAVWTDDRNGSPCTTVDQYRAGQVAKPNPDLVCSGNFGNSDIYSAKITY